ncbi:hypothetical protein L7F22_001557 [Adiantum nelumboides]|nr:hypothetical protein [Adiantum nelumboides]
MITDSGSEDDYAFFDSLLNDNHEVAISEDDSEEFWDSLLEDDYNLKPKSSPMIPKIALTPSKEYLEKISSSPNIPQLLENLKPQVLHRMKKFQDQSLEAVKLIMPDSSKKSFNNAMTWDLAIKAKRFRKKQRLKTKVSDNSKTEDFQRFNDFPEFYHQKSFL